MPEAWRWQFLGFESMAEGRPVQKWFDGLLDTDRAEILDLLNYLAILTARKWTLPHFDPLEGEGGISELRVPNIRNDKGIVTYRIYGYFGPDERQYCFLHGKAKDVKNDKDGKRVAKYRLEELRRNEATVHQFAFEKSTVVEIKRRN